MRGCPICSRVNESGAVCPDCADRLRRADELAGPGAGVGCATAVLLSATFWVTLAVILWFMHWRGWL